MSRRSLNFGQSFEELISLIPSSLSFTHINQYVHNEDGLEEEADADHSNPNLNCSNENLNSNEQTHGAKPTKTSSNLNIHNNPGYNPSEQAILSAIYNTIAISIFVGCLLLCGLLLIVLQAFVRSIMWALLTSAFLFSFKRYLTDLSLKKLKKIEQNGSTLAFESCLSPIKLLDSSVDYVWRLFLSKYRHLIAIVLAIILFHLAGSFYQSLFAYSISFITSANRLSNLMTYYVDNSWQLTLTLSVAYLVAISFYWNEKDYRTQIVFKLLSCPIWLSLFFLSTRLMGAYRPLFTVTSIFLICLGFYSFFNETFLKYKRKMSKHETTRRANNDEISCEDLVIDEHASNIESTVNIFFFI
jgi:hypothetical protein